MGTEENKRIVSQFVKSLMADPDFSVVSEDVRWWLQGIGTVNLAQLKEFVRAFPVSRDNPVILRIDHITAEEDRVSVEAHSAGQLADGREYSNTYHFLFFVHDGKIIATREHFDTAYAFSLFPNARSAEAAGVEK